MAGRRPGQPPQRRGNFVRWARRKKLTTLDFAATKWGGPSGVIDTETRWEQARWLLHDDSLKPEDRLAGLLVLLYAQRTSVISRLTLGQVQAADGQVRIRLGREPVVLPAPSTPSPCNWRQPAAATPPSATTHLGLAVPRPGSTARMRTPQSTRPVRWPGAGRMIPANGTR